MFGKPKKANMESLLSHIDFDEISRQMMDRLRKYGGQFEDIIVQKKTPLQEFTESVWEDKKLNRYVDRYADYEHMDEYAMAYSIYADDATPVERDRTPLQEFTEEVWDDEH